MNIDFKAKTNQKYIMINAAIFQTKDGELVTIDRDTTEYTIDDDGTLHMTWRNCYVWDSDKEIAVYPDSKTIIDVLVHGRLVSLELEDDAPDEDYEVSNIIYNIRI